MPAIYNCDNDIVAPVCDPCIDDIEHGRIRSVAFIHTSVYDAITANPSDATVWQTGIANKKIFIIPSTIGSFDGGSVVEGTGYGDNATRVNGYNFSANFKDPAYKKNCAFYNSISKSPYWHFAWRTETQTAISGSPVSVQPKSPVTEDLTSEVVWDVDVKWSDTEQPCPTDTPADIFICAAE